jgi:hypothetical protein
MGLHVPSHEPVGLHVPQWPHIAPVLMVVVHPPAPSQLELVHSVLPLHE